MASELTGTGGARETRDLVAAAQAGDRLAFGALYERFARLVHGVLLASARPDDVPDLMQDVWVTGLQEIHTIKDRAAFAGWIGAVARNRARMHHRAAREVVDIPGDLPAARAADDVLHANEVLRAVKRLPERYHEPLLLRLVEEMSGEEIAAHLGLSHGTVRVYLHQGMQLLRDELGKSGRGRNDG